MDITKHYNIFIQVHGPQSLPPLADIKVEISHKLENAIGNARFVDGKPLIRISYRWFKAFKEVLGEAEAKDNMTYTLLHELAHISAYHTHGRDAWGHSTRFYWLMDRLGYSLHNRFHDTAMGYSNDTMSKVHKFMKEMK